MENKEPTIYDVLEAINAYATKVDSNFQTIEGDISTMKGDISTMKGRLDSIEANMVTKDYLDDKLADLRGDLVVMMRKEDIKVKTLVEILRGRNLISEEDEKRILSLEPFPALSL